MALVSPIDPVGSLRLFDHVSCRIHTPRTALECLFTHLSEPFTSDNDDSNQQPAPDPGEDDETKQPHSCKLRSTAGRILKSMEVTTLEPSRRSRTSPSPTPSNHQPSPGHRASSDVRKTVQVILKDGHVSTLEFRHDPDLIMRIHHELLPLLNMADPLDPHFAEVWTQMLRTHDMTNAIGSSRMYEDGQQHPIPEQLFMLIQFFCHHRENLAGAGLSRLGELKPVHSTADKRPCCASDQACYCASPVFERIAFLLEAKRLDVGDEALFLINSILTEGASGGLRTFPVDPKTGSIDWSDVSNHIKSHKSFESATRILTQVGVYATIF